jgi:site-specific DNA recombinase
LILAKTTFKTISTYPPAARGAQRKQPARTRRTPRRLVSAIARGRRWLGEIVSGAVTGTEQLARREGCTVRQINLALSLAFLAPQFVKAAVEGRLPRGINIERLPDADAEWSRQFKDLGLQPDRVSAFD